jgi:hypothetical protein
MSTSERMELGEIRSRLARLVTLRLHLGLDWSEAQEYAALVARESTLLTVGRAA